MTGIAYWRCEAHTFGGLIDNTARAYLARPKGRGRPWAGEVAEHIIVAPPPGSKLTPAERLDLANGILQGLCPTSPACYAWHIGDDGRDELHLIASNFADSIPPHLRITSLRHQHDGDYLLIGQRIVKENIDRLNTKREREGRDPVVTMAQLRANKRQAAGHLSLPDLLIGQLGYFDAIDGSDIVTLLRSRAWTVTTKGKYILVTPPKKLKPYRWPLETLLRRLAGLRAERIRSLASRDLDLEIGRQLDTVHPRDLHQPHH